MDKIFAGVEAALAKWGDNISNLSSLSIKGEQNVIFFVFQMSLVKKNKTNCIYRFVG